MIDLIAIQEEQIAWSQRNFGMQSYRQPLLGMIEEICELEAAWRTRDTQMVSILNHPTSVAAVDPKPTDEVLDAIGDIAIYMLDYCGKRGWQLKTFWDARQFRNDEGREFWWNLVPHARKLAHHDLKSSQGIRGTQEEHDREIMTTLSAILAHAEFICRYLERDFLTILNDVWSKVRLRDWTKNRANAHAVAAQQVVDGTNMARSNDP